jgi:FkbM family methyltransferase
MLHTMERARSLALRMRWLAPIAGGTLAALRLAGKIRRDKMAPHSGTYNGGPLVFRGIDERALKEVLVEKEYRFLGEILNATDAPKIIDAGAHIGTFGLWALSTNSNNVILSVEADPSTFELLQKNAKASGSGKWSVLQRAAAGASDEVLRFSTQGTAMSHRLSAEGDVSVRTIGLEDLLDQLAPNGGTVDLVKVDIEGAEEAFLCTRPELLDRVDTLVVELHPNACDTDRVKHVLENRYSRITAIGGRASSKPLLLCQP